MCPKIMEKAPAQVLTHESHCLLLLDTAKRKQWLRGVASFKTSNSWILKLKKEINDDFSRNLWKIPVRDFNLINV